MRTVADLEADAFRRDRGFLFRLALVLVVGAISGLFMYGYLTGETVAGCAARSFGGVTTQAPSE